MMLWMTEYNEKVLKKSLLLAIQEWLGGGMKRTESINTRKRKFLWGTTKGREAGIGGAYYH